MSKSITMLLDESKSRGVKELRLGKSQIRSLKDEGIKSIDEWKGMIIIHTNNKSEWSEDKHEK